MVLLRWHCVCSFVFLFYSWNRGKRLDILPDGKRELPPMDTRNTGSVTNALVAIERRGGRWGEGLGYGPPVSSLLGERCFTLGFSKRLRLINSENNFQIIKWSQKWTKDSTGRWLPEAWQCLYIYYPNTISVFGCRLQVFLQVVYLNTTNVYFKIYVFIYINIYKYV